MARDRVSDQIEKIRRLYLEKDIYPFPYESLRKLQADLEIEFERQAPKEIICADLNTYWMFIEGLSSGGLETKLNDAVERYHLKTKLAESFFDWFPKFRFLERYDISEYQDLDRDFKFYDNLRLMLVDVIKLYEIKRR